MLALVVVCAAGAFSCMSPGAANELRASYEEAARTEAARMDEAIAWKASIMREVEEKTITEAEAENKLAILQADLERERMEDQRRLSEQVDRAVTEAAALNAEALKGAGKLATGDIVGGVGTLAVLMAGLYAKTKRDSVIQVNHERDQKYKPGRSAEAG